MNIPPSLPIGDSATWMDDPVQLADGRQADSVGGWALKYALRGPSALDLTAMAGGQGWATTLTSVASAALQAGTYAWSAAVSKGLERITCGAGQIVLLTDLTTAVAGFDSRSQAQIALADCEAAMATFNATGGKVRSYEIAGRKMEFQSLPDLMQLHSFWRARVAAEQTAQSIANGLGNPRNLHVRFRRP